MLAPPGYAKMVSTPSRSRQATRISLPDITGPISARLCAGVCLVAVCVVLLISALPFGLALNALQGTRPQAYEKTHDRCQPWVFVETYFMLDKGPRRRR